MPNKDFQTKSKNFPKTYIIKVEPIPKVEIGEIVDSELNLSEVEFIKEKVSLVSLAFIGYFLIK